MEAEVAFVILQLRMELAPGLMLAGVATKLLMIGGPGIIGLEGDEAGPVPIALVAVTVNV
jgi:hypothetical protein